MPHAFAASTELEVNHAQKDKRPIDYTLNGQQYSLPDGAVVIAAITCTNTSNPSVLMAAGLLARGKLSS